MHQWSFGFVQKNSIPAGLDVIHTSWMTKGRMTGAEVLQRFGGYTRLWDWTLDGRLTIFLDVALRCEMYIFTQII